MTNDDLAFAVEWLRSYESPPGDHGAERCERVAARLETLLTRRTEAAAVRTIARHLKVPAAAVRVTLARKGTTAANLLQGTAP